jgi:hypothetical protein
MTADEAWQVALAAMDDESGRWVFGYGLEEGQARLVMTCLVCLDENHPRIADHTPRSLAEAVEAFKRRHLRACADGIEECRSRLRAIAAQAPTASTPEEARRLMLLIDGKLPPTDRGGPAKA